MRSRLKPLVALLVLAAGAAILPLLTGAGSAPTQDIEVYFSPHGGATAAIVAELGMAKSSVNVLAYSFTSDPIAEALIAAHKRGVKVSMVVDSDETSGRGSDAKRVAGAGIPVLVDAKHAIAHNKVMVIDDMEVITGSFNFTTAAEHSNAENLLIIRRPSLAGKYLANWKEHAAHSKALTP
jgi:phosphatidylserine/phosphatidylglycerophosphate/cardiolipin synthase-like enzyme